VQQLLDKHYTDRPDGIPGNDDTGTMSAWAVFSMMGFYPDCPGEPSYTLTTPRFEKVEIRLDPRYCGGNDRLVITRSGDGVRIKGMTLGGKKLGRYRIGHSELVSGGSLHFTCTTP